jgi:hypothetical protein
MRITKRAWDLDLASSLELISHGTVFFSHNKSANSTFQPGFSAKRTAIRPFLGVAAPLLKDTTIASGCFGIAN